MQAFLYKILDESEWTRFRAEGRFDGSAVDRADGYIHFSTAAQAGDTAARHFAGRGDLILLAVDPEKLAPDALRWEPSRGGALFPHLYAPLSLDAVVRSWPLPLEGGCHRLPPELGDG